MKQPKGESGFTLIEIIVVLILLGIMAVALSNTIMYVAQSFIFARDADQLSQKAQLAMARINKELTDITDGSTPNTAVSFASADQIDYKLTKNTVPSCTVALPDGCQYRMKRTGTTITLEGINPVVLPQVLIDGLTNNNGGNNFLSYFRSDGITAWTTADGFSNINSNANYLATIRVWISLDFSGGSNHLDYQGRINPRVNGVFNAPQLN
jgi:prepilin-type N-terminal cleavage/methylation domain-containing protein